MKLCILSRSPRCYSTKRLKEAALSRGHQVRVLDTLRLSIAVEQSTPVLFYKDKVLGPFDAVIPRIGASVSRFGLAVVRQYEQMGVICLNDSEGIDTARDKVRSLQRLSQFHVAIPPTAFVHHQDGLLPAIERLGGAPVVIKLLEGAQGVGVVLADTNKVAQAMIEALRAARQNVLIQKFIQESRGRDVRAVVVGGKVVAAMRRIAQGDEFRSNVHRGARVEPLQLKKEYAEVAILAAKAVGLSVAGVDMLESARGPLVMEVNASPGLSGIETATNIDVAGAIIDHLERQKKKPVARSAAKQIHLEL